MAVVSDITIDKDGNPTTGPGDVLVGDRESHVASLVRRLHALAAHADKTAEEVRAYAEAVIDGHHVVAVGEPVPAEAAAPTPIQAPAVEAPAEPATPPVEAPVAAPVAQ